MALASTSGGGSMVVSRIGVALAAGGILLLGACSGGQIAPSERVRTPPAALTETEEMHLLEITAPTPGWSLTFERSELARDTRRLLFTLRRPDPTLFAAQRLVTLRAISDTPTNQPVTVLVRVVDHDASESAGRYARPTGLER